MAITKAEFARQLGISRQRVSQLVDDGLPVLDSGKLDFDAACDWTKRNASSESKIYRAVKSFEDTEPERDEKLSNPASNDANSVERFLENLLRGRFVGKAEAERVKENALAGLRTLELQCKASELVEFAEAKSVLFEQARVYRDALMQWPGSLGPLLAADLGVPAEQVTELLNNYVRQFLESLGEPDASGFVEG